jgi:CRP-like cAMP-binding protein
VSFERAVQFARTPLFADIDPADLAELAALTTSWSAAPGDVLFRQGDAGDRLLVVTSGELEAVARLPAGGERSFGTIAAGQIVGELALLARGRRTATVRAVSDSRGFSIARETFDLLRLQLRPVARTVVTRIGEIALERLAGRYGALARELEDTPPSPSPRSEPPAAAGVPSGDFSSNGVPDTYLAQTLFFRRFAPYEITALRRGMRVLSAPRGARIETREQLWIVLRGAVQTSVAQNGLRRRVRLAGPGRCVGQVDLLPGRGDAPELESTLRERAVLLEVPHARAHALLAGDLPGAERFGEAFHEDVVRALLAAEEQLAPPIT